MPPVQPPPPNDVVEIDSSSDDDDTTTRQPQNTPSKIPPSTTTNNNTRTLESRSFWKAGDCEVGPTKWTPSEGQLEHARVHPKFLHTNATSHKWAFGAIAELLDNAVDEICNGATFVKVDRIYSKRDNSPALLVQDDGGGMDPNDIRKCMSLGYSSKKSNDTIGQYGNGFKTSTMRLGADVIVFSCASRKGRATRSVGLLSYTFLRRTGQDDVIVPMVDFDVSDHWAEPIVYGSGGDWSSNLNTILEWSPFASKDELMEQFEDIGSHGTKIIIFNLWLNDEGIYELNFDEDDEDIKLRDEANHGGLTKLSKKGMELQSHISYRIRYSLRAYASMLYLRKFTNFKILLRGKPVEYFNIADELRYPESVTYKPQLATFSTEVVVQATLGFIKEAPALGVCGYNVYHKNRLIRPFWKVTGDGQSKGNGVVGVLEANFIEPAHDKQDFERSSLFTRLEAKLKQFVMDYWKGHCHLLGFQPDPSFMRKMSQGATVQPHSIGLSSSAKKEMPAVVGLSANAQREMPAVVGLSANAQREMPAVVGLSPNAQREMPVVVRLSANAQREMPAVVGLSANAQRQMPDLQPPVRFEPGFNQEVACVDSSRASSIDEICDENIQLFMRCEEHRQKETQLKSTVEELEKQLAETKRKCAELALRIEVQRKQKLVGHQTGKV